MIVPTLSLSPFQSHSSPGSLVHHWKPVTGDAAEGAAEIRCGSISLRNTRASCYTKRNNMQQNRLIFHDIPSC